MPNLRRVGREGEDRAADYLVEKGYTIVTRRHHTRRGEIDLVAMMGDLLVFVEVKERRTPDFVPEEALDERKIGRLREAAAAYLVEMGVEDVQVRFDVIGLDSDGIRHHEDAFR
jgi:putative endonuclease